MTYYKFDEHTQAARSRFDTKYEVMPNGCWEWTMYRDADGYGQFTVNIQGKKHMLRAHRFSWMIANQQDWPDDQPVARHLCNNPSCVNPEHIVPGTVKENTADAIANGTQYNGTNSRRRPISTPYGDFDSIADAARALNVRNTLIWGRIAKGEPGYHYK
jgi:HNH endonuclease